MLGRVVLPIRVRAGLAKLALQSTMKKAFGVSLLLKFNDRGTHCSGYITSAKITRQTSAAPKVSKRSQDTKLQMKPEDFHYLQTKTVLPLKINNKILPFPLPDMSTDAQATWNGSSERAPFLNRKLILSAMLQAAFDNFSQPNKKPTYAVQTMHPGSGKSRLMIEWIYHALNDPEIVQAFLLAGNVDGTELNRKVFINALYKTAFMQQILIMNAENLPVESDPSEILKAIIKHNIMARFANEKVSFKAKTLKINTAWKNSFIGSVAEFIDLFGALVDKFCDPPTEYPFEVDTVERRLLIFGLDECQVIKSLQYSSNYVWQVCSNKSKADTKEDDFIYKVLSSAATARIELRNSSYFWLVTGTIVPGRYEDKGNSYHLIKASMENLLSATCLNTIAEQYFGKCLPNTEVQSSTSSALHKQTAKILIGLFYQAFGVPRGIEILLQVAYKGLVDIEKIYSMNKWLNSTDVYPEKVKNYLKGISNTLDEGLAKEFPHSATTPEIEARMQRCTAEEKKLVSQALELLDIKAAFCLPLDIKENLPHLEVAPQVLEERGYLIQWAKINENKKQYTRPFLHSHVDATKPLSLLQSTVHSDYWKPFDISYSMLTIHPLCSNVLDNSKTRGRSFIHAIAASIYARYILASQADSTSEVELQNIFDCKTLPAELHTAKVTLKGVVVLKQQFNGNSAAILQETAKKQVIAIDEQSSKFADVLMPAKMDGSDIFIGFHTKQSKGSLNLMKAAENALVVLQIPNFYFVGLEVVPQSAATVHAKMITIAKKQAKAALPLDKIEVELQDLQTAMKSAMHDLEKLIPLCEELVNLVETPDPKQSMAEAEKAVREMTKRVSILSAKDILSPIYQTYFGFASAFGDKELGCSARVSQEKEALHSKKSNK